MSPSGPADPPAGAQGHTGPRASGLGGIIARNTVWTVAGRVVFLLAWALITPFLLRQLGPDRFALWALFFALSGYFATFDLGMSQSLVKFVADFTVARDRKSLRGIVTLATLLYGALGAAAVAVLAVWRQPVLDLLRVPEALRPEAGWCLLGMAVVLAINNLVGVMSAVLNGRQRMDVTNAVALCGTLVQIAGVVVVLRAGWGLRGLVVNAGVALLLTAAGYGRAWTRIAPDAALDASAVSRRLLARLVRYSAALQLTNLGGFVQFQLDKLLLAHFVLLAAVTPFELGYRLCAAAWVLPMLLLPPLVPAFSHLAVAANHEQLLRLYRTASRYLAAATFPTAAFVTVCAPALVTAWLGSGYASVALVTAGMSGFLLLSLLTGVCTAALRGMEQPWLEARYHVLGMALHLALSLWLVPRASLAGALLALGSSGALSVAYLILSFHRRIGEPMQRWGATLAWPAALSVLAGLLAVLWQGRGPGAMPESRLQAWLWIGQAGLVFPVVVGAGYLLSGFISVVEVRAIARGVLTADGGAIEPR